MPKLINIKQNTPEWHDFRSNHLGASEASTILGKNPWESVYSLWYRRVNGIKIEENEAMRRGKEQEPLARALYNRQFDLNCEDLVFEHDKIPFMSASLDGWDKANQVAIEIKCSEKLYSLALDGKIPEYYNIQMQHQMEVMGINSMDYVVYFKDDIQVIYVERDQALIDQIILAEADFWHKLVYLQEPEMTESDYVEILDPRLQTYADEYKTIKAKIDLDTLRLKELKNKMTDLTDGLSAKGFGVKIRKTKPSYKTDYKKYVESLGVQEEELKPFQKYQDGHWMIMFDKE